MISLVIGTEGKTIMKKLYITPSNGLTLEDGTRSVELEVRPGVLINLCQSLTALQTLRYPLLKGSASWTLIPHRLFKLSKSQDTLFTRYPSELRLFSLLDTWAILICNPL